MKPIVLICDNIIDRQQLAIKNASVLRLANQLRKRGADVHTIYHASFFSKEEILKLIPDDSVIGISNSFFHDAYQFASYIKQHKPNKIMIGGWGTKLADAQYSNHIVFGDGLEPLLKLSRGEVLPKVIKSEYIKDYSDQSSTPSVYDHIQQNESLTTELARGCIFSCSFCDYGALGKKKNEFVRSYESLRDELKFNYENFGTTYYTFSDNIVNDYDWKLETLIQIRKELNVDIRWSGYVRLDTINEKQAILMRESGIAGAVMGIESMKKTVGSYIGKMTDPDKIKAKLRLCRDVWGDDTIIMGLFISGLPTETIQSLHETHAFLNSTEGRYLIDGYKFSTLKLDVIHNDKIKSQRKSGNPFSDYVVTDKKNWTSPWGTKQQFNEARELLNDKFDMHLNKRLVVPFPFTLSQFINLNYTIDEVINNRRTDNKYGIDQIQARKNNFLTNYKQKRMNV